MVIDPALASVQYPYGQMIHCPICDEPRRQQWLMQHCGLEGRALDYRLRDWRSGGWTDGTLIKQREQAFSALQAAIHKRYGLFTFWGDFGSGKTFALAIAVNECRANSVESYYAPLANIFEHLRSLYNAKKETSNYWQRLCDIPVLAIDEVTRFNATDWATERLFMLIDIRYRRRDSHLTLFATNDRIDGRRSDLGYMYSRMSEGVSIELRGDMRPVK